MILVRHTNQTGIQAVQNLQKDPRSGVWRVRKQIPADVQSIIGKREILVSLQTKDYTTAKVKALPILGEIERQIAEARNQPVDLTGPAQDFLRRLRPDEKGSDLIDMGMPWRPYRDQAALDQALIQYRNATRAIASRSCGNARRRHR